MSVKESKKNLEKGEEVRSIRLHGLKMDYIYTFPKGEEKCEVTIDAIEDISAYVENLKYYYDYNTSNLKEANKTIEQANQIIRSMGGASRELVDIQRRQLELTERELHRQSMERMRKYDENRGD